MPRARIVREDFIVRPACHTGNGIEPGPEMKRVNIEQVLTEWEETEKLTTMASGTRQTVYLPERLSGELLEYSKRRGILSGPVFIARNGTPIIRTNAASSICQLGVAAQVPKEKGNPRCPRRLCQTAKADIEADIALLMEQTMDRQLEQKRFTVGGNA